MDTNNSEQLKSPSNLSIIDKSNSFEATSNLYLIHCMNYTLVIMLGIWILNLVGIFPLNKDVMLYCMISSLVIYFIGTICWHHIDISDYKTKYYIILWTVVITTIMGTGLTYHAILASVLPLLFCSMYSSKRIIIYTSALTIISTFIIVLLGYHIGICDANMALLPGEPLSAYIDDNSTFARTLINERPIWNLTLFFVFPRSLIYIMCMIVCYNIGKINRQNTERAKKMEFLAEIDGMTGLYNKSKYLSLFSNEYSHSQNIAVIFWDINYLKKVNDTFGHEIGDQLIRTVADNILILTPKGSKAYRIGGDEFVMVVNDANDDDAISIIEQWRKNIALINFNFPFKISAAIGYACGSSQDLQELINKADKMMYEDKKSAHAQRE